MQVRRIGFTPVKGARHRSHDAVGLTREGPRGDRVFCLVDPVTGRCLRTVENPALLQACASWDGTVLSVDLPSDTVVGQPVRTGEVRRVDYWGRATDLEVVQGPWAAACSAHLGREVLVATGPPGAVVYGGAVTLVASASLARLEDEVGAPVDGARFRATLELDSGEVGPHVEEDWVGRRLRIGTAEVRVRRVVQRCAVIDLHPEAGVRDLRLLEALARYRPARGAVAFGLDAAVTVPGEVRTGDPALLGRR